MTMWSSSMNWHKGMVSGLLARNFKDDLLLLSMRLLAKTLSPLVRMMMSRSVSRRFKAFFSLL